MEVSSKEEMKVFHLISSAGFYGAERVIVTLSQTLKGMGHPATIGVFHNDRSPHTEIAIEARAKNIPVQLFPCKGRLDWNTVRLLRDSLKEYRPDIVHAHGFKADIYGYLATRRSGAILVSTCHTWYDNDLAVYWYGVLDRFVLRRFDMSVAVSNEVAQLLRSSGVGESRIQIVGNGINVLQFACARPALLQHLVASTAVVGLVGRLAPEKGIKYFLDAAAIVLRSVPEVVFVVVGDGPERKNLEAAVRSLGIENNVHFAGKLDDMAGVYASLDILVSSSLKEGLPMTILEALAAGRPVVATAVGAVPEVVLHERTGLLTPPADAGALAVAILRLLGDCQLREKLAVQGRRLVEEQFSAEAMATQYVKVYDEVVAARRVN
jgi:glycosyltransferase involved in cell wall biosynthesis